MSNLEKKQHTFDRGIFLNALGIIAERYGLDMKTDIDIDLDNWTIKIEKDMELYDKINLIAEIEHVTGGLA